MRTLALVILAACLGLLALLLLGIALDPEVAITPHHAEIPLDSWHPFPSPTLQPSYQSSFTVTKQTTEPKASPTATPKARIASTPAHSIEGTATWYAARSGAGAAGPELRVWLGPTWRGMTVRVCAAVCVTEVLSDWCACRTGHRLIDLPDVDFARLGRLSLGVIPITVAVQ